VAAEVLEFRSREAWLAARRDYLTASDVAAVLGEDVYGRGPLSVWLEKVKGVEVVETPWMRRGRRLEQVIAEEYSEVTGRTVRMPAGAAAGTFLLHVHPEVPFLAASLDRETAGSVDAPPPAGGHGWAPLELKAQGAAHAYEWRQLAPTGYLVQNAVQIACSGATWGSLAGLVGLEASAPTVRDTTGAEAAAFLDASLSALDEFWHRVKRGRAGDDCAAPPADASPSTARALTAAFPPPGDKGTVALDHAALELTTEWNAAKARRDQQADLVARCENELMRLMGDATFGALPDGWYLRRDHGAGWRLWHWHPRTPRRS
jgi:putative phage-type endonuclease